MNYNSDIDVEMEERFNRIESLKEAVADALRRMADAERRFNDERTARLAAEAKLAQYKADMQKIEDDIRGFDWDRAFDSAYIDEYFSKRDKEKECLKTA